jgi:sulfopyruvate decarboxylase subunit alpha
MLPHHKQSGSELLTALQAHDVGFVAHVPCAWLEGIGSHLTATGPLPSFVTPRADSALATAAGAWLGGKLGCVCLPSTALVAGGAVLQGVLQLHGLPCVLLISWRGEGGAGGTSGTVGGLRHVDTPETHRAGETLFAWLDVCNVRRRILDRDAVAADVTWAVRTSYDARGPTALIVRRGVFGG